jgi:hypothetical protein
VTAYRLYRLDGTGRIDTADWLDAASEEAAVGEARKRFPQGGFELWHKQQLVRREPRG